MAVGVSWPSRPTGKLFWPEGGKKLDHPGLVQIHSDVFPQVFSWHEIFQACFYEFIGS